MIKYFGGVAIASCSTDEKCETAKKYGADFAINYKKTENLAQEFLKVTDGKGVNIILDCVASSFFKTVRKINIFEIITLIQLLIAYLIFE